MSTTEDWDDVNAALAHLVLNEDIPELTAKEAAVAIHQSGKVHRSPLALLVEATDLTYKDLTRFAASVHKDVDFIDLADPGVEDDIAPLQSGGIELFDNNDAFPVIKDGYRYLVAAVASPRQLQSVIRRAYDSNTPPKIALGYKPEIKARIARVSELYVLNDPNADAAAEEEARREAEARQSSPVQQVAFEDSGNVGFIVETLEKAAAQGASDVHIGLDAEERLVIRYRIDGKTRQQLSPGSAGKKLMNAAIGHAHADIGRAGEPQSTKFEHISSSGKRLDVRSELTPTINGPKLTWRLLDSSNAMMKIADMGLAPEAEETLRQAMGKSSGMIITTGPTGSGKSTSQYALLQERLGRNEEIITIEDPVEYKLAGVTQVQVTHNRGSKGVTWIGAIKSALRADPDVILVGEMRDQDTAQTAVQAAMTGHLVLSTLHTNSALGVFARLIDLGVDKFLAADQVRTAIGQRLVRRLHGDCAREAPIDARTKELLEQAGIKDLETSMTPVGCDLCHRTGFKGRTALMELLVVNPTIQDVVRLQNGSQAAIQEVATEENYIPFYVDARRLIEAGITAPKEVLPLLSAQNDRIWRPAAEEETRDLVPVSDAKAS